MFLVYGLKEDSLCPSISLQFGSVWFDLVCLISVGLILFRLVLFCDVWLCLISVDLKI
jgi:hypothetical protein